MPRLLTRAQAHGANATDILPTTEDPARGARVAAIGTCHGVNDLYAAFLAPLLPAFIDALALSKAQAGLLSVFYQGPSLLQPLIGHLADRRDLRALLIAGPAITGIALSLIGVAPGYAVLALLLVIGGLSSAGMHSVGAPLSGELAGPRLGRGMSIWMVTGELGYAIGATFIVSAVQVLTLRGTPWLMLLGLAASGLAFYVLRDMPVRARTALAGPGLAAALRKMRGVLVPVCAIVILRSFLEAAASIYLPTFLTSEGSSLWLGGIGLSVVELAGVVGVMLGGSWSDRIGTRRVLALSLLVSPLFMFLFVWLAGWARLAALVALGMTLYAGMPVILTIMQGSFPENRALASGIYMAAAFSLRSGVVVLVGAGGDTFGLRPAFLASAALSLLALLLIPLLPGRPTQAASAMDQTAASGE